MKDKISTEPHKSYILHQSKPKISQKKKKKRQNYTQIPSRLQDNGIGPKKTKEEEKIVGLGVPGKMSQNRSCTVRQTRNSEKTHEEKLRESMRNGERKKLLAGGRAVVMVVGESMQKAHTKDREQCVTAWSLDPTYTQHNPTAFKL